ncbi:MAG: hypothetical protein KAJ86_02655 [Alphaproteobacteria bacterium]|nr:hypothetical protein [Alphaproteobacteria bacterium]
MSDTNTVIDDLTKKVKTDFGKVSPKLDAVPPELMIKIAKAIKDTEKNPSGHSPNHS